MDQSGRLPSHACIGRCMLQRAGMGVQCVQCVICCGCSGWGPGGTPQGPPYRGTRWGQGHDDQAGGQWGGRAGRGK